MKPKMTQRLKESISFHYPEQKKRGYVENSLTTSTRTTMAAAVPHGSAYLLPVSAARPLSGSTGEPPCPTLVARVTDLFRSIGRETNKSHARFFEFDP
jgi:hypothetical protein